MHFFFTHLFKCHSGFTVFLESFFRRNTLDNSGCLLVWNRLVSQTLSFSGVSHRQNQFFSLADHFLITFDFVVGLLDQIGFRHTNKPENIFSKIENLRQHIQKQIGHRLNISNGRSLDHSIFSRACTSGSSGFDCHKLPENAYPANSLSYF